MGQNPSESQTGNVTAHRNVGHCVGVNALSQQQKVGLRMAQAAKFFTVFLCFADTVLQFFANEIRVSDGTLRTFITGTGKVESTSQTMHKLGKEDTASACAMMVFDGFTRKPKVDYVAVSALSTSSKKASLP